MTIRVLEDWQGLSLEDLLRYCRDLVEDAEYPTVKRWRQAGGKVVGHFEVYFPEEIVAAAGLLPVKIHGAPIEARQGDAHFGAYLCSIVKTSLELALSGRLELEMFVSHPICDTARNLAAVWGRNVSYPCEILYLPQNANSLARSNLPAGRVRPAEAGRRGHRGPGGDRRGPAARRPPSSMRTAACCGSCTRSSARRRGCSRSTRPTSSWRSEAGSPGRSTTSCWPPSSRCSSGERPNPRTGCGWCSRGASASSRRSTC